ncbi:MAG: transposase [Deltaproteobacteria bacterium]|jgi:transposase|nr:transposase [Deltaproteobacteria bacterium]MBT4267708.1 transposase [Deltaproteobacteria bacterium]MBT4638161.1 transposase [Deltaproteobacteria bacterium]MBT6499459.1 transposase [Deltaproteobacteria bacterium]MBT6613241.1 transposase [Deltaproteobacteria bacterium]
MKFIDGQDRHQLMIPNSLDQHISENNPIWFIDAFVENLDIGSLGFKTERKNPKGRAAYHPTSMLKLYIYGYLNKIRSSRDLERETFRNIELYWLINHLHPDHSSIARYSLLFSMPE